ncbi:beta-propeller fold lactonase family protein [Arthrobacter sp. Y-9]|uniref:lactonase family protein n=1 Tax=Arthrobacter sp. Y-9 TaxID=3039385 RepID=UPI00241FDD34|nr:beta-propeller fold lactonase family protein [Arthrobacter sp. Y-9]WFR85006.1 beta-propeller fold lactonase family protein [Arthrobacter sp. Y-9]
MNIPLYLGSYTEDGFGCGPGVQRVTVDPVAGELTVLATSSGVRNPSFLLRGPGGRLFAVEELDAGQVVELDPETLAVKARVSSGGSSPCHLGLAGGLLLVANYGSGTVSGLSLDEPWGAEPLWTVGQEGAGPVADRQEGPHAHSTLALGEDRFLVADLGRDRVDEYLLGEDGPELVGGLDLPLGTGPRHLLLDRPADDGTVVLWVVGELDAALHRAIRPADGPDAADAVGGSWALAGAPVALAPGHEQAYPSEITGHPGSGERALVVGVRGSDTLAVVGRGEEETRLLRTLPCGGAWPRHLAWACDDDGAPHLCVAAERGHRLSVFVPGPDGDLTPVGGVGTFSPTYVLPVG